MIDGCKYNPEVTVIRLGVRITTTPWPSLQQKTLRGVSLKSELCVEVAARLTLRVAVVEGWRHWGLEAFWGLVLMDIEGLLVLSETVVKSLFVPCALYSITGFPPLRVCREAVSSPSFWFCVNTHLRQLIT